MVVRIITDSICAPSLKRAEELGVHIVPINIHFGTEIYEDLFGITPECFYQKLVASEELPTTSAPSIEKFASAFNNILKMGDSVFCLTVTSELSNTFNVAHQARNEFSNEEKEKILIFDTQSAGAAASLLVVEASLLSFEHQTIEEIEMRLQLLRQNTKLVIMFDTLKYIEKSGKVGKVAAVAGDMFNIKPLICLHQSKPKFFGRARGKSQAIKMILDEFIKDTADAQYIRVAATHANAEDALAPLIQNIIELHPEILIDILPFTSAMGTHAGPGIIGIGYLYEKNDE